MKVSVVIPFYSNIIWLEEAVQSVLNQTYKDFEIIIVNDGSPEEDSLFLSKYEDKVSYFKTLNGGPAKARNYGIEQALGEYIAFLDSDDLWEPKKLEIQLAEMLRTEAVWSHTNYSTFNEEGGIKEEKLDYYNGKLHPKSLYSMHVATPSVMVKRDILTNKEFRFQEKMRFGQDYYLWLVLSKEYPLLLVKENLCKVRIRGTNAALRARAHIQVRAQIWNLLKDTNIFELQKYQYITKQAYSWCAFGLKCISFFERKGLGKKGIELLSRVFYTPSFMVFKIIFNKYKRNE